MKRLSLGCLSSLLLSVCGQNYDNQSCTINGNCLGGRCDGGKCKRPFNVFFRNEISEGSGRVPIPATYLSAINAENGGYVINPSSTITITGKVRSIFEIDPSSFLDKYTHLEFDFVEEVDSVGNGICIYSQADGTGTTQFTEAEDVNCVIIGSSAITNLNNVIVVSGGKEPLGGKRKNWALEGSADQSSQYSSGDANNAIDGDTTGVFNFQDGDKNSVTSTVSEIGAWWEVDLGSSIKIQEVVIHKRVDGYSGRLLNYDLHIIDFIEVNGNLQETEVWRKTFDGTVESNVLTIDIVALSGRSDLFGQKVKISLNSNIARILSLAEVKVFGDYYNFDVSFGALFNLSKRTVNRIVFIQDGLTGKSTISDITLVKKPVEPISVIEWALKNGADDLNIQGSSVTRSENGDYIGLTDPTANNKVIFYNEGRILYYEDAFEKNIAISIANNGFSVCSFATQSTFAVRILKIGRVVSSNEQGNKIGGSGFGRGVSITPSANKVAIGNPTAGTVSIFTINSFGEFSSSAVDIVAPVEMKNMNFGERVGLSKTGNSIAIAVPLYNEGNGGDDIGCVLLYLYNAALSRWELVNSYIYGSANNLKLGQGGVAVDDVTGRLDATDSAGDRLSYLYTIVCNDPFAVSIGRDNNAFEPACECNEGRKSSNEVGGKLLQNSRDACIPCEAPEGFGDCKRGPDGPTAAPTPIPITQNPTSITTAPSSRPTFITDSPSSAPSWSPASLYDGDACVYNAECKVGVCENGRCKAEPFSISYQASEVDPEETLSVSMARSDLNNGSGGIIASATSLTLYENVKEVYTMSKNVLMGRNTRLKFTINDEGSAEGFYICFYPRAAPEDINLDECANIDVNDPLQDLIGAGLIFFGGRTVYAKTFVLLQSSGKSSISSVMIFNESGGIFCGNACCDIASDLLDNPKRCICKPGYVSSSGNGRLLTNGNFCESCVDTSNQCGFDGDSCTDGGDCWIDKCDTANGICLTSEFDVKLSSGSVLSASLDPSGENASTGGVLVREAVYLLGDALSTFQLSEAFEFNKGTNVRLDLQRLNKENYDTGSSQDSSVEICLHNERDGDLLRLTQAPDESRCALISTEDTTTISFGKEQFMSKRVLVNFITLKQVVNGIVPTKAVEVVFSAFNFSQGSVLNQVSNGKCTDPNASPTPEGGKCVCIFGYVSSNGGNVLNEEVDACVPSLEPLRYDGHSCNIDRDCLLGVCQSNMCKAGTTSLVSGDDIVPLELDIGLSTQGYGGVLVDSSRAIRMYNNTRVMYKLSNPVRFNRFTEIQFTFAYGEGVTSLKLCLYISADLMNCPSSCYDIPPNENSPLTVSVAPMISYQEMDVSYIGFVQEAENAAVGVHSVLRDMKLSTGIVINAYENGKCTDPNSRRIGGPERLEKCICTDGFLSSNGGKVLRNIDACVSCLDALPCALPRNAAADVCSRSLVVEARLGGMLSQPVKLNAKEQKESITPVFGADQGGGSEVLNERSIALYGTVSKTYKLDKSYLVNKFSRLYTGFSSSNFDGFLALCMAASDNFNSNSTCYTFTSQKSDYWESLGIQTLEFNLALNKPTSQSGALPDYQSSYAVDGDRVERMGVDDEGVYPMAKTLLSDSPFWEVDLEKEYTIREIVIYFTKNSRDDTLSQYFVEVLTGDGSVAYRHDEGDTQPSKNLERIQIPEGFSVRGARVRITMLGDSRVLALREVEVYEDTSNAAKRIVDLPIGKLLNGKEVNYLAFIQSTNNRKDATNFDDITFIYGYVEQATPSPTSSPSASSISPTTANPTVATTV